MIMFKKFYNVYNFLTLILLLIFATTASSEEDFTGRSCKLITAITSSGEGVTGRCYFKSNRRGVLEGATTSSGEKVTGTCFRYNYQHSEIDEARTASGKSVRGDCAIGHH